MWDEKNVNNLILPLIDFVPCCCVFFMVHSDSMDFTLGFAFPFYLFCLVFLWPNTSLFRAANHQFICLSWDRVTWSELAGIGVPKGKVLSQRTGDEKEKTRVIAKTSRSCISLCQASLLRSRAPNTVFTGRAWAPLQHGLNCLAKSLPGQGQSTEKSWVSLASHRSPFLFFKLRQLICIWVSKSLWYPLN